MPGSIPLSPKHGVNPGMGLCFYCGEPVEVILYGRQPQDAEAPRYNIVSLEPCAKCAELMKQGIFFLECRNGTQALLQQEQQEYEAKAYVWEQQHHGKKARPFIPNPAHRTGRSWVLTEDSNLIQHIKEPFKSQLLRYRWAFIGESDARQFGLPHDEPGKEEPAPSQELQHGNR